MCDAGLEAGLVGIASNDGALGCTKSSRNRDVVEEGTSLLIYAVRNGFGRIDWRTSTNRDDSVNAGVLLDQLGGLIQLLDWCVLSNLAEGARMLVSQELFHLLDQVRLAGQRVAGDDEGFACVFRQAF